ncbi:hypothetical protein D3C72_1393200 [compost metagenome]
MAQCTAGVHRHIHGAAADIHYTNAELALIFGQYRIAGGQTGENKLVNFQTTTFYCLNDVLSHIVMAGDQVHLGLHTHAGQPNRVFDAFLIIDGVFLRDDVQDAVFITDAYRFSGMHHVLHIFLCHFLFGNRNHPYFVLAADVFTR